MAAAAAEARAVYRLLLRAVDRNITSATGNTAWRQQVAAEFRRGAGAAADPAAAAAALQLARDYAFLITSVREHKVSPTVLPSEASLTWAGSYGVSCSFQVEAAPPGGSGAKPPMHVPHLASSQARPSPSAACVENGAQELLLSYNIGLDVGAREKQMNQRAANLVGLSIPPRPEPAD